MKIRKLLGYSNKDFIHAPKLFDALSILFATHGLDFDYRVMPDDDEIFYDKVAPNIPCIKMYSKSNSRIFTYAIGVKFVNDIIMFTADGEFELNVIE